MRKGQLDLSFLNDADLTPNTDGQEEKPAVKVSALKALIQSDTPLYVDWPEPQEEVRPVPGMRGIHASQSGNIWSNRRGEWRKLKQKTDKGGYQVVIIDKKNKDGKSYPHRYLVHRLVLLAWKGEPPEGHVGMHLNDIKSDCRLENLAWGTVAENNAMAQGKPRKAGLKDEDVELIRALRLDGYSYRQISQKTNVARNLVQSICTGKAYKRLKRDAEHGPINRDTLKLFLLRPKLEPFVRNDIFGLWNHVCSPVLVYARNEGLAREIASGQAVFPYHDHKDRIRDPWLSSDMSDCILISNAQGERLADEHFISDI